MPALYPIASQINRTSRSSFLLYFLIYRVCVCVCHSSLTAIDTHTHTHTHTAIDTHTYQLPQHLERSDVNACRLWGFRSESLQSSLGRHEHHLLPLQHTEAFLTHGLPQMEHESAHTHIILTQRSTCKNSYTHNNAPQHNGVPSFSFFGITCTIKLFLPKQVQGTCCVLQFDIRCELWESIALLQQTGHVFLGPAVQSDVKHSFAQLLYSFPTAIELFLQKFYFAM